MSAGGELGNAGLLTGLLKSVSRSFYLTMQILPGEVRHQISLAYLLARTSDTIADTAAVPVGKRLETLREYAAGVKRGKLGGDIFGDFIGAQENGAERILLQRAGEGVGLLGEAGEQDQGDILRVLSIIISGQEQDLLHFHGTAGGRVKGLANAAALEDYTYKVAGCVGEFWTTICYRNLYRAVAPKEMIAKGIDYGKGLQLINILRDLPRDFGEGRVYLPEDELREIGVKPEALLEAGEEKVRPVFNKWLGKAEKYIERGWVYTVELPKRSGRVKLACAWPALIGAKTIEKLRKQPVLDPGHRVKISRGEVRNVVLGSIFQLPFKARWEGQLQKALHSNSKCC